MNVTFLIGNGFDIACGLKTSYQDFITYYIGVQSRNRNIEFFKGLINEKIETWSDAELAFGKYTEHFKTVEVSAFRECRDDFIKQLAYYLGIQEARISADILSNCCANFLDGLTKFDYHLPKNDRDLLTELYNEKPVEQRFFNILIFNYTDIFERMINQITNRKGFIGNSVLLNDQKCANLLRDFIYVHGKRTNAQIVFGVDNKDQIQNKELLSDPVFELSMLKPKINNELYTKKTQQCLEIVQKSSFICIYGMSIGLTDTTWWVAIVDWLKEDHSHQLIYYAWSNTCTRDLASNYLESLENCRAGIYRRLRLSGADSKLLRWIGYTKLYRKDKVMVFS